MSRVSPRPSSFGRRAPFWCRGALPLQLFLVIVLGGLSWTDSAHAYAWMIRHDYTACGTCHADPSGGELLTRYGRVTSDLILSMDYGGKPAEGGSAKMEDGPGGGLFWDSVDLPESLLLSGAYRNLYVIKPGASDALTLIPVMQADLYGQVRVGPVTAGGSIGLGKVSEGTSLHVRAAQVTTNQDDSINMISRNHYLGVDIGSEFLLRAGRLNLPFGLRIPEHTAWVRETTRTDRESDQQHGVAVSYTGEKFRAEVMGIAGNYQTALRPAPPYDDFTADAVRERGYSMYAEGIAGTSFATGITSKVTHAKLDRITFEEDTLRQAHGLTARWAAHKSFSLMGEADALFRSRASAGYVGFVQADWEPIQGLHFIATGEIVDRGLSVPKEGEVPPEVTYGAGAPKYGGWFSIDWFFFRQMEFRTDFVFRQQEPITILGQVHLYL
jgi:hypothetical protein